MNAALELIDERGLAAFSMRALATRVDAHTASIYWHVGGRDQLLSTVAAGALRRAEMPAVDRPWEERLRAIAHSVRDLLSRHPNFASLIAETLTLSPTNFAEVEGILSALAEAGLSGTSLRHGYNVFVGFAVGYSLLEFAARPPQDPEAWLERTTEHLATVTPDRYPVLAANLDLLGDAAFALRWHPAPDSRLDDSFEVGLDMVIAGVGSLCRQQLRSSVPRGTDGTGRGPEDGMAPRRQID